MTDRQALQEAKDRWGKKARIEKVSRRMKRGRHTKAGTSIGIECRVGTTQKRPVWGEVFAVKGIGQTWEDAFRQADGQRAAKG